MSDPMYDHQDHQRIEEEACQPLWVVPESLLKKLLRRIARPIFGAGAPVWARGYKYIIYYIYIYILYKGPDNCIRGARARPWIPPTAQG